MSVLRSLNMNKNAVQVGNLPLERIELVKGMLIVEEVLGPGISSGGIILPDSARQDFETNAVRVKVIHTDPEQKRITVGQEGFVPRYKGQRIASEQWAENDKRYFVAEDDLQCLILPDITLDHLEISIRTRQFLRYNGIETIDQLTRKTYAEISHFGTTSCSEIQEQLEKHGLKLAKAV